MGKRNNKYEGTLEYDEGFVGYQSKQKAKPNKGRRDQQKATIALRAESTFLEDNNKKEFSKNCWYFKIKKIDYLKAKIAGKLIKRLIYKNALLKTVE